MEGLRDGDGPIEVTPIAPRRQDAKKYQREETIREWRNSEFLDARRGSQEKHLATDMHGCARIKPSFSKRGLPSSEELDDGYFCPRGLLHLREVTSEIGRNWPHK
jgi:hypothetical protein